MAAPMTRSRHALFTLAAAGCFFAAAYHLTAMTVPTFGAMAYPSSYPAWRHVLFVSIDTTFGVLFVRRPRWLIWPYLLLLLQIFNGHGVHAWGLWRQEARIDWPSVITIVGGILGLWLLLADRRTRQQ
jgi:hypothetical protein